MTDRETTNRRTIERSPQPVKACTAMSIRPGREACLANIETGPESTLRLNRIAQLAVDLTGAGRALIARLDGHRLQTLGSAAAGQAQAAIDLPEPVMAAIMDGLGADPDTCMQRRISPADGSHWLMTAAPVPGDDQQERALWLIAAHDGAEPWSSREQEQLRTLAELARGELQARAHDGELDALRGQLGRTLALYQAIVEDQSELICRFRPDGRLTFANAAFRRFFRCEPDKAEMSFTDLMPGFEHRRIRQTLAALQPDVPTVMAIETGAVLGTARWLEWIARAVVDDIGRIIEIQAVGRDITERIEAEQRLEVQAQRDDLTGLFNRRRFTEILDHAYRAALRDGTSFAVILLDLDQFKDVNDTLGHEAGDALLRKVASRLRSVVRAHDTVARLGGDEFAVLVPETHDDDDIERLIERLVTTMRASFDIAAQDVRISASAGFTVFANDEAVPASLLAHADMALYAVKAAGGNGWRRYETRLGDAVRRRQDLRSALARAVEDGAFHLVYQPIVRASDLRPVAIEALIRWHDPLRGTIPPAEFIAIAERHNLIDPITRWVLDKALGQLALWNRDGILDLPVAVNLSAASIAQDRFHGIVERALDCHRIAASNLILEVTESAVFGSDRSLGEVRTLAEQGIHIAIDDFGAASSSLSQLSMVPLDHLKVDRSILAQERGDARGRSALELMAGLARCMGITAVAEGIETERHLKTAREAGIACLQGHYVSEPLEPRELAAWMHGSTRPPARFGSTAA